MGLDSGKMSLALRVAVSSVVALGAMPSAHAQEAAAADGSALEEVIVTATKRSEKLQDVPVSVTAMTADQLSQQGVFSTADLNGAIPNLQVSSAYGETQPNFTLRGIGVGTEYNSNAASPVGVYVDEVYQSFRASHGQQLYDLEQVEVVRGPQGTLFGRNTTGGAINFLTRKPRLDGESHAYVNVGYGSYDRVSAEGATDLTVIDDVLGFRIAGTYVNSTPYIKNVWPVGPGNSASPAIRGNQTPAMVSRQDTGISPGGHEIWGFRAQGTYKPSDGLEVGLKLYASSSFGGLDSPQNAGNGKNCAGSPTGPCNPALPPDSITLLNSGFAAFGAGLLPPNWSPSANGLDDLEIANDQNGTAKVTTQGVVLSVHSDISESLSFTSISGFDTTHYGLLPTIDCDGTPYAICAIGYESISHSFNQDLRLSYAAGRNKFIAGLYYGRDGIVTHNTPSFYDFLNDEALILGFPRTYWNPPGIGQDPLGFPTGLDAKQDYTQVRRSTAVYLEGSRELTDTLKLTVGVRHTKDKFEYKDALTTFYDLAGAPRAYTVSDYAPNGQYQFYYIGSSPGTAGALNLGNSSNATTGRVILDWKPRENVLVYGSFSRGYRGGTYNGLAFQSSRQVYFVSPETVNAFEVGIKSRFLDNRLQFNASAFHYDYKDQQQQLLSPSATTFLVNLDGKMDGLDAELVFAATDTLRLNVGLGILDSSFDNGACPAVLISEANPPPQRGNCLATGAGNVDVGGNPFPYAADFSANAGFDWDALRTDRGTLTVHADVSYTGRYFYDTFGDYDYTAPTGGATGGPVNSRSIGLGPIKDGEGEYALLNARLTYDTGSWMVAVYGKNLTDEVYYPNAINVEGSYGSNYRMRAAPRMWGVEFGMKF